MTKMYVMIKSVQSVHFDAQQDELDEDWEENAGRAYDTHLGRVSVFDGNVEEDVGDDRRDCGEYGIENVQAKQMRLFLEVLMRLMSGQQNGRDDYATW